MEYSILSKSVRHRVPARSVKKRIPRSNRTTVSSDKLGRYRSGLEKKNADLLRSLRVDFEYETVKIEWHDSHKYMPDFILPNGIIVETKGLFLSSDRSKHLKVREQHPHLDIRFVFSNSNKPLYKRSKSTYADWCDKYGFVYADKLIPIQWIGE